MARAAHPIQATVGRYRTVSEGAQPEGGRAASVTVVMALSRDDQSGRVLGGRYRLRTPVGTGASAIVYEADDVQLRRRVAVKLLHPTLAADASFLKRFRAEAQAAAGLSHPNVMAVFDWGEDQGTPYLVLEYLAGGSLRAMLDRGRQLNPSQALLVGLEAARGLDYAHKRGVVHRDIKPANLLFGEDGRLRIADFGLARAISEASWTEPDGVMLGTARYASPEQATGQPLSGKSDVYSLTLSIVEAVTGQVPFAADTTVATLMNRLGKLMPVSADLGPLAAVLERAGRPEPEDRYDAAEFGRALLACAERLPRPTPLPLVIAPSAPPADATEISPIPAVQVPQVSVDGAGPAAVRPSRAGPAESSAPPLAEPNVAARAVTSAPPAGALLPVRNRMGRGVIWALIGVVVLALVAIGGVVLSGTRTKSYAVPSLVGVPKAQAENDISPFDFTLSTVLEKSDEYPEPGIVVSQDPSPQTKLKKGGVITVHVSDGPTLSKVPDLTSRPKSEAEALLTPLKLTLNETSRVADEGVAPDSIISWTVAGKAVTPGDQIPKGSVIDIVVSSGPAPRRVPEIRGMNWEQAKAAIEAVQLKAQRLDDIFNEKWAPGIVASIEPGVDAELPRDGVVQIAISKGPDNVVVPNIYGSTIQKAEQLLADAGLVRDSITGDLNRNVLSSDPKPGTVVKRGAKVSIRLG
jgi:eukaryotic-like serine/threonine-protein kinase